MNKNYNKNSYKIAAILLIILFGINAVAASKDAPNKTMQDSELQPGIYILVSFSMSDKALRNYFEEANIYGAKLVMNGLVGNKASRNRFAQTKARMEKARINVDINPNLFERLSVRQVPVIAVVNSNQAIQKISGNITLVKALEIMEAKRGNNI